MEKELQKNPFNQEVDKYHEKFVSYARGMFYSIKREHGLTNEELALVFGVSEEEVTDFLHENWVGCMNSRILSVLYLLTGNNFEFNKVLYKKPDNIRQLANEYITACSSGRHEKNVNELLGILGIENENDLEILIKVIKETLGNKKHNG